MAIDAWKDLWYFEATGEYGETIGSAGQVAALPPETVIYRAAHLTETTAASISTARGFLSNPGSSFLLRPVRSSDGPPFRSVLIYASAGQTVVSRAHDWRGAYGNERPPVNVQATRYRAAPAGEYVWDQPYAPRGPGFFLTGSGASALWRIVRAEQDALNRQILTLQPLQLAHGLAVSNFDNMEPKLRAYLTDRFDALQRALASAAPYDVVDRASNIAHAVVGYCLEIVGRTPRERFADRLQDARAVLEDKVLRDKFPLNDYAYHLAHKIRVLHARSHPDQAVEHGRTVRPEVGISVASDLSEFLVEVGLARY